jgi:hypothetical protein
MKVVAVYVLSGLTSTHGMIYIRHGRQDYPYSEVCHNLCDIVVAGHHGGEEYVCTYEGT